MILEQHLWKAKRGQKDSVVALAKAELERRGIPFRVYTSLTHPGNIVIWELQFQDMAENAKCWARWNAEPQAQEFQKQLHELTEIQHHTELYQVL